MPIYLFTFDKQIAGQKKEKELSDKCFISMSNILLKYPYYYKKVV